MSTVAPAAPVASGPVTADVGVVICAYADDRWTAVGAAIRSVLAQDPAPRQVVVVIDHNDLLHEAVRRRFPEVTLVRNRHDPGVSGARTTGIEHVHTDLVAFLDDDAAAQPGWLAALVSAFDDERVIGADSGIDPDWDGPVPRWFPAEFLWVVGCSYRGLPETKAPVRNVIGASMAFRRDVFVELGGFRRDLGRVGSKPIGCEETELSIRAVQARPGAILLHEPAGRVRHRVPAWRMTRRYFRARCYDEGRSKALMATMVGRSDGLSSERRYATRVLPTAVIRNLLVLDRDRSLHHSWDRALTIVAGLVWTVAGYVVGTGQARRSQKLVDDHEVAHVRVARR